MSHDTDPLQDPAQFLLMSRGLIASGRTAMFLSLAQQARARHGSDPVWQAALNNTLASEIPKFHSAMLQDQQRNRVYRKALEKLGAGRRVLDIGTGSGLLAMMAVRAGAEHVYACESNVFLADAARRVVAANKMEERITIIAQPSTALDPNTHLKGGVDLVVSEVMADNLLGEGMLPSLAHAREELCLPDAIFIPSRAAIKVALAHYPFDPAPATDVDGFDLSAHFQLLPQPLSVRPDSDQLTLRSDPATLFAFDFSHETRAAQTDRRIVHVEGHGERANAIAQWIAFEGAPGLTYENAPGGGADLHWRVVLTQIDPVTCKAGEPIAIEGYRDTVSTLVKLA